MKPDDRSKERSHPRAPKSALGSTDAAAQYQRHGNSLTMLERSPAWDAGSIAQIAAALDMNESAVVVSSTPMPGAR
jgi:hypothetical protein